MTSDVITIEHFQVDTTVGVHDWEQQQKQPVIIDLKLYTDCQQAADSDDLKCALDYFELTERLRKYLTTSRCALIETLAHNLITEIFKHYPNVSAVDIHLKKPEAVNGALVGVKLTRQR
ncbi:dihydroneopterin aldolase [Marinicella gelatinilytica]|uniref:dihydroneopterin aldolase n=1 Tax=Marinicella gelatinilytica TaxID=2996017 RepID=UPI002260A7C0|nr:dihydroneopterin aldolase [Marinicella gelatinilytica]MCX7544919.1 dihydroneopterin aldolase [Marinicella gelatinilytica]